MEPRGDREGRRGALRAWSGRAAWLLAGALAAVGTVYVLRARALPDLEAWHRVRLEQELGEARAGEVRDLEDLLALEERLFNVPELTFLPNFGLCYPENSATWWQFSPEICGRFIKVLGFEKFEVNFHYQLAKGAHVPYFTLVGTRTREMR